MMETQNQRDENKKRSLECISRINEVEGFSPESLKEDMMVDDTVKPMLSLQYKKAWFRMKYPSGKISTEVMEQTENYVMFRARVHQSASDDMDVYIGEGLGIAYRNPASEEPEVKQLNDLYLMARGSAESHALYDAGFGLQFYSEENDFIEEMANKPITERTIPKDDNTGYVPMDAGLETVPPMDMGPDDDSELSMATTDDNEKKNRSKRTYQEIYEDAQVAMDKLLPDIASLKIKVVNETDELKKAALTKQLSRMENKWEKHRKETEKAIKKGVKGTPKYTNLDLALSGDMPLQPEENNENEIPVQAEDFMNLPKTDIVTDTETDTHVDISVEENVDDDELFNNSDALDLEGAKDILCTFKQYNGKTYGAIYAESPSVLVWLFSKKDQIPEKELMAISIICQYDEALSAKIARQN